jgi:hypothetical protein
MDEMDVDGGWMGDAQRISDWSSAFDLWDGPDERARHDTRRADNWKKRPTAV